MIETKILEVRDSATCLVVFAMRVCDPQDKNERRLLAHAGYGESFTSQKNYVFLSSNLKGGLHQGRLHNDIYDWGQNHRTMINAHQYIKENWLALEDGSIVDVEHFLGETEDYITETDMP